MFKQKHSSYKNSLYVFHSDFLFSTGGEKYLFEILKRISTTNSITLFVQRVSTKWERKLQKEHIVVKKLWCPKHLFWLLLPISILVNYARLKKIICRRDIIFTTNFPFNLLSVLLSNKVIYHCFEPFPLFYDRIRLKNMSLRAKFFLFLARIVYIPLDKYAVHYAHTLTTINSHVASYIQRVYNRAPDKYLPNGVDAHIFYYRKKNYSGGQFTILHSTDYTILKGTELLLHALPHIISCYPRVHLNISESVNNFEERNKYLKLIRTLHLTTFVSFVGSIKEKQLPSFYQKGDLFCSINSPYSGGGSTASLSVLESESCGTPVIRSFGGINEIIEGKTGYYIHYYSEWGIAQTIMKYMKLTSNKKILFSVYARKHVQNNFNWNEPAKTLTQLINNIHND